ncbi:hypothetical protein, partial [Staphylococcus epidermidis]|uniref:hypothetical protein n=1 Tax=Staphylococcus epidermidis TaxID=1282 RepID=UPI001C92DD8B
IYNHRNQIIHSQQTSQLLNPILPSTFQPPINHFINQQHHNPHYTPFINYLNHLFFQQPHLQDTQIKAKHSQ